MKEELLKILQNNNNLNITFHGIKKLLNSSKRKIDNELRKILFELECEGKIYCDENEIYHNFPHNFSVNEIIQNKEGKYFIRIGQHYHEIKKNNLSSALNNDIVICKKSKGKTYEVVKVLKRSRGKILCALKMNEDNHLYLEPINSQKNIKIGINHKILRKYPLNQKFIINLYTTKYDEYYDAKIDKVIGDIDKIETIAITNGFYPEFSEETITEIQNIPSKTTEKDLEGRLDLRNKIIYTIDDETAKDLDDAICVEKLDNGHYLLYVSIAHVSNYVKYGSSLFNDAFERGTSAYLLNSVFPMLPHELSNGICSLNEGDDRLTRSVIMEYDENGNQIDYKIVKSVINSKKKMAYDKVNSILEDNIIPKGYEGFVHSLLNAELLALKIIKNNSDGGTIDFDSSEKFYIYDENEQLKNITIKKQQTAQKIIECFMIEANCTIAKDFYYKKLPFLYRNHNIPDMNRFINTIKIISNIGYRIDKIKDINNPKVIQNILNTLSNKKEFPILSTFILRSMEKATYNNVNSGHYGLAKNIYTHFTSPIRRLCDLVVHMLIDYYEDSYPNEEEINKLMEFLNTVALQASIKEKDEIKAEYEAQKYADVMLMKEYIGHTFNVYITDITSTYIKVKTDNLIEGIINLKDTNEEYTFDYKKRIIRFESNGLQLSLCSNINATLIEANEEERNLYFSLPFILKKQKKEELQRKRALHYNK